MRILSIDWDYFMDCTSQERESMFPDGGNENLGDTLLNGIWASKYAHTRLIKEKGLTDKCLEDVGIKEQDYEAVKLCMFNFIHENTEILLADSHATLYKFIKDLAKPDTNVELINVDYHSDCYDIGDTVNCGNWVTELDREKYLAKYIWINGNSPETLTSDRLEHAEVSMADINYLKNVGSIDAIFICRSNAWAPPHHDKEFNKFRTFFESLLYSFDNNFFIDRYNGLEQQIKLETEALQVMIQVRKENEQQA